MIMVYHTTIGDSDLREGTGEGVWVVWVDGLWRLDRK